MWCGTWSAGYTLKVLTILAIGMTLGIGCASIPSGLEGEERQLKPVSIGSIETVASEQGIRVVIEGSRPFSYSLSNHEMPPRVLVAIPDGKFVKLPRQMAVKKGVVQAIVLQERDDQARVEIALERLVNYGVQKEENRLVLSFQDSAVVPSGRGKELARTSLVSPGATEAVERLKAGPQGGERYARVPGDSRPFTEAGGPANPLEYIIGGMDVLEVTVYQEKDLSKTYRVSADGDISFPLLGNVRLAGLTPPEAGQRLQALLRGGYLKSPQVSVTVTEYRSKGVAVLGAVKKPGSYQLSGGKMTLLEVLSMAEGVSLEEGSKSLILVRQDEKGETKSLTIDVDRLLKEGDVSLNMTVQPNDAIYVTRADAIIVYGEVKKPGTYPLESKGMTVLEAISRAEGLTQYAAPNRTRIIRVLDGKEKSIQVRVSDIIKGERTKDVTLQPGDVIVVPESYF